MACYIGSDLRNISGNGANFFLWNAPQLEIFYEIKNEIWGGGSLWATSLAIIEGKGNYVWSNRLLAPYVVLLISKVGITYKAATIIFYWVGIFIINFMLFLLIKKTKPRYQITKLILIVVFFNFMFLIFQDRSSWGWFYTFDIFSIIFFTIFPYLVINKKPLYSLVLLFFLALTNREDAVFIAFSVLASAFVIHSGWPYIKLQSLYRLTVGAGLGLFAVGYTKYVRDTVSVIKPTGPDLAMGNSVTSLVDGIYSLLIKNFMYKSDPYFINAPDSLWLLGSGIAACLIFKKVSSQAKNLIITYIVMILAIIIFGNVGGNEVRLYLPLIPMFIFILLSADVTADVSENKSERLVKG